MSAFRPSLPRLALLLGGFALMIAASLSGCGSTPLPDRVTDLSGSTAIRVLFESHSDERIEIRGLRFRSSRRESTGDGARGWLTVESRETLTAAQLAEVADWIDDGALELTSPDGRRHLSSLAPPPPTTLRIERGTEELGIGWNSDDVWTDAAMGARVESTIARLRQLARSFER